jgi:exodeoxyribonuclease VII small subunit
MAKKKKAEKAEGSFEEDLSRLDDIVKALEEGDLPLDEAVKLFKEGTTLAKRCSKKLNEAESRIEKIVEEDGKIEKKEFEGE